MPADQIKKLRYSREISNVKLWKKNAIRSKSVLNHTAKVYTDSSQLDGRVGMGFYAENLNNFQNVSIAWIPGHAGVHGTKVAGYLAKPGSKSKSMVLNLLVHSRKPVVLAQLRTGPQIDGNLCEINRKTP